MTNCGIFFFLKNFFSVRGGGGMVQTNWVYSIGVKDWSTKISCSENILFLLKSSFLLPGIDQTNCYCNDDQGMVLQNCIFHDPWGRGSCAKVWPYKSTSNKRPMGHIAHLRNQFESINQFEQNYDYIYIIKLAQYFRKRRFLNFVNVPLQFCKYLHV